MLHGSHTPSPNIVYHVTYIIVITQYAFLFVWNKRANNKKKKNDIYIYIKLYINTYYIICYFFVFTFKCLKIFFIFIVVYIYIKNGIVIIVRYLQRPRVVWDIHDAVSVLRPTATCARRVRIPQRAPGTAVTAFPTIEMSDLISSFLPQHDPRNPYDGIIRFRNPI